MADEPSIDEILASLDRLLKEGEGRNDEPEEALPPADEPASPTSLDAPTPHFFEVLDDEAEAPHADAGASETEADGVERPAGPEEMQEAEAPAGESGTPDSRLFVLTDAMMVDDQPSLPLGMDGEAADATATETEEAEEAMRQALEMPEESGEPAADEPEFAPEPETEPETGMASEIDTEPETAFMPEAEELQAEAADEGQPGLAEETEPVAWDEAELQALVDQVTDDVCSTIAEQLPEMIRMALAYRLGAFIDTRTKHQETGSQE